MKSLATIIAFLFCLYSFSQALTDYGYADPSIPELSQFEYYIGEWTSEMEVIQKDSTFKKLPSAATVIGRFLEDHKTYQSQFTMPNGFFSTDVRTFNTTTKKWQALFLNAQLQRWHEFSSSMVDGKMTTIVIGGYSGQENFDVKAVDTVISDRHYLRDIFFSNDQMETWKLVYKISITKVSE